MVNYPSGVKQRNTVFLSKTSASDRGMVFEKDINQTNDYYLEINLAVIHKKPTPVQVVKVDYPSRNSAKIVEAYYKTPSTTDYNGIYKGKYLDFEAKESASLTSFPLKSIHPHQLKHLKMVLEHGAIAFVLFRFTKRNETYYVKAEDLLNYIQTTTKSSIPIQWFLQFGYPIPYNYVKPVDYLQIVNKIYF